MDDNDGIVCYSNSTAGYCYGLSRAAPGNGHIGGNLTRDGIAAQSAGMAQPNAETPPTIGELSNHEAITAGTVAIASFDKAHAIACFGTASKTKCNMVYYGLDLYGGTVNGVTADFRIKEIASDAAAEIKAVTLTSRTAVVCWTVTGGSTLKCSIVNYACDSDRGFSATDLAMGYRAPRVVAGSGLAARDAEWPVSSNTDDPNGKDANDIDTYAPCHPYAAPYTAESPQPFKVGAAAPFGTAVTSLSMARFSGTEAIACYTETDGYVDCAIATFSSTDTVAVAEKLDITTAAATSTGVATLTATKAVVCYEAAGAALNCNVLTFTSGATPALAKGADIQIVATAATEITVTRMNDNQALVCYVASGDTTCTTVSIVAEDGTTAEAAGEVPSSGNAVGVTKIGFGGLYDVGDPFDNVGASTLMSAAAFPSASHSDPVTMCYKAAGGTNIMSCSTVELFSPTTETCSYAATDYTCPSPSATCTAGVWDNTSPTCTSHCTSDTILLAANQPSVANGKATNTTVLGGAAGCAAGQKVASTDVCTWTLSGSICEDVTCTNGVFSPLAAQCKKVCTVSTVATPAGASTTASGTVASGTVVTYTKADNHCDDVTCGGSDGLSGIFDNLAPTCWSTACAVSTVTLPTVDGNQAEFASCTGNVVKDTVCAISLAGQTCESVTCHSTSGQFDILVPTCKPVTPTPTKAPTPTASPTAANTTAPTPFPTVAPTSYPTLAEYAVGGASAGTLYYVDAAIFLGDVTKSQFWYDDTSGTPALKTAISDALTAKSVTTSAAEVTVMSYRVSQSLTYPTPPPTKAPTLTPTKTPTAAGNPTTKAPTAAPTKSPISYPTASPTLYVPEYGITIMLRIKQASSSSTLAAATTVKTKLDEVLYDLSATGLLQVLSGQFTSLTTVTVTQDPAVVTVTPSATGTVSTVSFLLDSIYPGEPINAAAVDCDTNSGDTGCANAGGSAIGIMMLIGITLGAFGMFLCCMRGNEPPGKGGADAGGDGPDTGGGGGAGGAGGGD